jgi:hypothetical protein
MDIVLQSITKDLSNIILNYCDIDNYTELYKLNSEKYTFDKYEIMLIKKFEDENQNLLKKLEKSKSTYKILMDNYISGIYKNWNHIKLLVNCLILNKIYKTLLINLAKIINILFKCYNSKIGLYFYIYNDILAIEGINILFTKSTIDVYSTIRMESDKLNYIFQYKGPKLSKYYFHYNNVKTTLKLTPIWKYLKKMMIDYQEFLIFIINNIDTIYFEKENCEMEIMLSINKDSDDEIDDE